MKLQRPVETDEMVKAFRFYDALDWEQFGQLPKGSPLRVALEALRFFRASQEEAQHNELWWGTCDDLLAADLADRDFLAGVERVKTLLREG